MKKLTTITVAFLLLFTASAFSMNDASVSAKIKTVFEKDFASASNIVWTQKEDIYVASFTINYVISNYVIFTTCKKLQILL